MTEIEEKDKNILLVDAAGEVTDASRDMTIVRAKAVDPRRRAYLVYVYLPLIFLTAALLGGLRFSAGDGSFVFLKPSLVCLIFAAMLMLLAARARLINISEWFSEDLSLLENAASGVVIGSIFVASTQIFNSLIPEQGLPYWIVAFCFFWTLWNNLFAEFDTRRLVRSLGALFALAFVVKYLVLLNLSAPADQGWLERIINSPSAAAAGWLLDVPAFSAATGYVQFFAVALYMLGLYLTPSVLSSNFSLPTSPGKQATA
jgi:hypothetical protein